MTIEKWEEPSTPTDVPTFALPVSSHPVSVSHRCCFVALSTEPLSRMYSNSSALPFLKANIAVAGTFCPVSSIDHTRKGSPRSARRSIRSFPSGPSIRVSPATQSSYIGANKVSMVPPREPICTRFPRMSPTACMVAEMVSLTPGAEWPPTDTCTPFVGLYTHDDVCTGDVSPS